MCEWNRIIKQIFRTFPSFLTVLGLNRANSCGWVWENFPNNSGKVGYHSFPAIFVLFMIKPASLHECRRDIIVPAEGIGRLGDMILSVQRCRGVLFDVGVGHSSPEVIIWVPRRRRTDQLGLPNASLDGRVGAHHITMTIRWVCYL
jgi:hypothetical protein